MVEITATGQVTRYSSTLTSIRWMFGGIKLAARDVRLLRSSAPVLAPRDGYMIFDFGDLRGILTHDRLALIGADRPVLGEALGEEVQRRLVLDKLDGVSDEQQPFEARALECMLEQVYTTVDETLQRLSVLVSSTLGELTNRSSFDLEGRREAGLGRLLPLRISLSALQARSRRISTLLHELLDSDAHVKDMCLTHHRLVPKPTSDEGFAVGESGSAEGEAVDVMAAEAKAAAVLDSQELIETLLDVYDARFNSLCDQIKQLTSTIENTQEVLELTLDDERNRIARLELVLNMAGISFGACSAIGGFFGMNVVTASSILLTGSLFATCWRQFKSVSRRQHVDVGQDVDALKNVLANLDLVSVVLRNRPPLPSAPKAMEDELRKLLHSSGVLRSSRELSLLCSLLMQQQQAEQPKIYDRTI
ncbi:magnesium transporter mrs2-7 [Chrysochromulina tobinii]|uniref:Magnesium transporter mrs2-7 n=1 Tax=Chrysochromulina tobinii TaxID=1460289 RepID=A0A0M0JQX4_9EUKA|nr:magnesium transporter mrs2-7 [Chrysochromulina tobinii]|eukprot:KOO28880.1 magnesium transporter mrs2-7 [Chrysochromulina sp. CCMP291]